MKKKLPWFLLTVSLCFNIFFLIGAARVRRALEHLKTAEGRARIVAEKVGLDEDQAGAIQIILTRQKARLKPLLDEWQPEIERYWKEATTPDVSAATRAATLDRLAKGWKQAAAIRTEILQEMLSIMTPEQQRAFLALIRRATADRF